LGPVIVQDMQNAVGRGILLVFLVEPDEERSNGVVLPFRRQLGRESGLCYGRYVCVYEKE
jgi:hypothetical protein